LRLGRQKPRFDAYAALERVHVKNWQTLWKEDAEFAAVESQKDRIWK
jgi:hypothetical protein